MPRFVILAHDWPTPHYDLMLERDGVLKTWRLAEEPSTYHEIAAEPIADHRLFYLDYEGPIDGHRGSVTRWDGGIFTWFIEEEDSSMFHLEGQKIRGTYELLFRDGKWIFFRGGPL